ncbi:MAG: gamma-glutamyltransferase [candidate division Zixibacteria bacterium]|nr:gamma-glutamyltransferase [candidate division Zixibacteria bacterium]
MLKRYSSTVRRLGVVGVMLVGLLFVGGCDLFKVTKLYELGVVVSVSPIASEVGQQVLSQGGNAFDAAVAVGFALAVTYPQAGNLGGGGFAVVCDGNSDLVVTLDFREMAPEGATEGMYLDENGKADDSLSTRGALAVGVPGTVAGLHALWENYGTMPWSDLVNIAGRLADTGFVVDQFLADAFDGHRSSLVEFEETRAVFSPDGVFPGVGDRFAQPDLARSLYQIAAEGPAAFYSGSIADSLVACMEKHGGLISHTDLESYRPAWRPPLKFTFDSLTIYSMLPPSSGGLMLGQILKLLEPYDFSRYTPDAPEYIHLFCEASRLAYADRSKHLGDPAFYDVPMSLLDSAYLEGRRDLISLKEANSSVEILPGNPLPYESDQTTHYSICDSAGNMVSITTTLNAAFGSGLVVAGAGFLLNNEMDDFSIKPGHPNRYGLIGSEANRIEPGKRMLSSMTPTLVFNNDRPFLILGSPGGSKIITIVAQAIINFTRFGLSLEETVEQPRFHHQWLPDKIYLEEQSFSQATIQRLQAYGHQIKERSRYGDLEMILIAPTGLMSGASDSRYGGAAVGCNSPTIN